MDDTKKINYKKKQYNLDALTYNALKYCASHPILSKKLGVFWAVPK